MTDWTVTSTELLDGLRDPENRTTWQRYVERYRPMIVRYAVRLGAEREEAEDLAQTTLVAFSGAFRDGRYDRERGRLRSWLFAIAHRQIKNGIRRRKHREVQVAGDAEHGDFFEGRPDDHWESVWDDEWQDSVLRHCLEAVRQEVSEQTWAAFDLFACREQPAEQVGEQLGMTANAVFAAKRRVLARLRELQPRFNDDW